MSQKRFMASLTEPLVNERFLNMKGYGEFSAPNFIFYWPHQINEEFQTFYKQVPKHSPISELSYYYIYLFAKQSINVDGDFYECGVFRGGSAAFISRCIAGSGKAFHLFDTFAGMPETNRFKDPIHVKGDFSDTSLEEVKALVGHEDFVVYHPGFIPETFPKDAKIAFAHVDVDIYQSVKDSLEFIYPRMTQGGIILLDDYGHYTCAGARDATDEFFIDKPCRVISIFTNQAFVMKL